MTRNEARDERFAMPQFHPRDALRPTRRRLGWRAVARQPSLPRWPQPGGTSSEGRFESDVRWLAAGVAPQGPLATEPFHFMLASMPLYIIVDTRGVPIALCTCADSRPEKPLNSSGDEHATVAKIDTGALEPNASSFCTLRLFTCIYKLSKRWDGAERPCGTLALAGPHITFMAWQIFRDGQGLPIARSIIRLHIEYTSTALLKNSVCLWPNIAHKLCVCNFAAANWCLVPRTMRD